MCCLGLEDEKKELYLTILQKVGTLNNTAKAVGFWITLIIYPCAQDKLCVINERRLLTISYKVVKTGE